MPRLLPHVLSPVCLAALAISTPLTAQSLSTGTSEPGEPPEVRWALAIHGGAGTISKDLPEERRRDYVESLAAALDAGRRLLSEGAPALEAVVEVVRILEDDPLFNAGKGAVFTHEGTHELDAAVMDGTNRDAGAVTGIRTVKNPILLARAVMTETPHVFMMGDGAEALADRLDLERVGNSWFDTERRREQLERAIEREKETGAWHERFGTVGAAALDVHGHLAAATSTGGLTNKRFGRIGDVPVIGAGTYADDRSCALSGTGSGEQFIRHTATRTVAALVEHEGLTCGEAARRVVHERLRPGDGGVIGVGRTGEIVWELSTEGMFRGAASSEGRFEVAIWEDLERVSPPER